MKPHINYTFANHSLLNAILVVRPFEWKQYNKQNESERPSADQMPFCTLKCYARINCTEIRAHRSSIYICIHLSVSAGWLQEAFRQHTSFAASSSNRVIIYNLLVNVLSDALGRVDISTRQHRTTETSSESRS